jgi:hypothetical protein
LEKVNTSVKDDDGRIEARAPIPARFSPS